MNADVKQLWIDALHSGEYTQGINRLCTMPGHPDAPSDRPSFCCLGVLSQLAAHRGLVKTIDSGMSRAYRDTDTGQTNASWLGETVMRWAGLDERDPILSGLPASVWNDDRNTSFHDIAEMIEEQL